MTTVELRHQIDEYIECLSPERLRVAVDFLAYLAERESQEATDELLNIPQFMDSLEKAEAQISTDQLLPLCWGHSDDSLEKAEAQISTDSYRNWRDIRRDV